MSSNFAQELSQILAAMPEISAAIKNTNPSDAWVIPPGTYKLRSVPEWEGMKPEIVRQEVQRGKNAGTSFLVVKVPFVIEEANPDDEALKKELSPGPNGEQHGGLKEFVLWPHKDAQTGLTKVYEIATLKIAVKRVFGEYPDDASVIGAFVVGCMGAGWDVEVSPQIVKDAKGNKTVDPTRDPRWTFKGCYSKPPQGQ